MKALHCCKSPVIKDQLLHNSPIVENHPVSKAMNTTTISSQYIIIVLILSALCTYLLRALPFLIFRGDKPLPGWLERLGDLLPTAIMAVLVIYCLKDGILHPGDTGIPCLVAAAAVIHSYRWKHNTLLSIAAGTAIYMLLLRL